MCSYQNQNLTNDLQKLPGVILSRTDDGFYHIGTAGGRLENQYTSVSSNCLYHFFLTQDEVSDKFVKPSFIPPWKLQTILQLYRRLCI